MAWPSNDDRQRTAGSARCVLAGVLVAVVLAGCGGSTSSSAPPPLKGFPSAVEAEQIVRDRGNIAQVTCTVRVGDHWRCPYTKRDGSTCEATVYGTPQPNTYEICKVQAENGVPTIP